MQFSQAFELWTLASGCVSRTVARYRRALELAADEGIRATDDVTRPAVSRLVDALLARGRKASTINCDLAALASVLTFAASRADDAAPLEAAAMTVNAARLTIPRRRARDFLTADQIGALLRSAADEPAWVRLAIVVAACTGVRGGELVRIHREDVDLDARLLHVRSETKNGRPRDVPLAPPVMDTLRGHVGAGPLFPAVRSRGSAYLSYRTVLGRVRALGMRLGLRVTMHTFRRSFATLAVHAGVPTAVVRDALGHHSVRVLEEHYLVSSTGYVPSFDRFPRVPA